VVEIVEYASIETVVVAYLQNALAGRGDGAAVATKVPNPRPDRFVRVTAAGGSEPALVLTDRTVIFECWDLTSPDASHLAERSFAIMRASMRDHSEERIRNVKVVGLPVSNPDPDTSLSRYQFTLSITLRGSVSA
jgi:hypothetical protein